LCLSSPSSEIGSSPLKGCEGNCSRSEPAGKGKTNLDFTEARDSEWQWHQLGYMQVCISLQTDNHASTPLLSFLQSGCPSCRPTKSVKALKASVSEKVKNIPYFKFHVMLLEIQ